MKQGPLGERDLWRVRRCCDIQACERRRRTLFAAASVAMFPDLVAKRRELMRWCRPKECALVRRRERVVRGKERGCRSRERYLCGTASASSSRRLRAYTKAQV